MKVTSKGQVTIPIAIREKYGIHPDMDVDFEMTERGALLVVSDEARRARARRIIERLTGSATTKLTTDELMALMRPND